jgi:hypothetical protein
MITLRGFNTCRASVDAVHYFQFDLPFLRQPSPSEAFRQKSEEGLFYYDFSPQL